MSGTKNPMRISETERPRETHPWRNGSDGETRGCSILGTLPFLCVKYSARARVEPRRGSSHPNDMRTPKR
jgi:hypothetical protein